MWGGGGMSVRSDVTSGRNWCWEWCPDAEYEEDGITTLDASGHGPGASDAGINFADVATSAKRIPYVLSLPTHPVRRTLQALIT